MKFLLVLLTLCFSTILTLHGQTLSTPTPITRQTNDELIAILPVAGIVQSIAFNPDGLLLVTAECNNLDGMDGCWDEAGLLTFWETESSFTFGMSSRDK